VEYIDEHQNNQKPFSFKTWAKMWLFIRPHKRKLIPMVIFMFICAVMDMVIPLISMVAIDE
jgi:ABC-type bacteriocin/lantibiotic exporter with double-glycine peptidase domain